MRKFFGTYGVPETLISVFFACLLFYFNYVYFNAILSGSHFNEKLVYTVVFIEILGAILVALPIILKKSESITNEAQKRFLDLPNREDKITFPAFSSFLSDQALASFLATILVVTGREALSEYGGGIAAVYTFFLLLVAITLAIISLIRFTSYFSKHHWGIYGLSSFLSIGIVYAFFQVGVKLAG